MTGVFEAFQGKKNGSGIWPPKNTLTEQAVRAKRGFLPALAWLSLVGLLASRARLRFTRQKPAYSMIEHCPALPFTTSGGNLLFALPMPEKTHSRLPKPDQSPTNSGEEPKRVASVCQKLPSSRLGADWDKVDSSRGSKKVT